MSLLQKWMLSKGDENFHLYGLNIYRKELDIGYGTHISLFYNKESKNLFYKTILKKIKQDKNYYKKLKTTYFKIGTALIKVVDKIYKDKFISIDKSIKNFSLFCKSYFKLTPGLPITTFIGRIFPLPLEKELKKELKLRNKRDIEKAIALLTFPDESSPMKQEELSLLKIGAKVQQKLKSEKKALDKLIKTKCFRQPLEKHIEEFGSIPVNFVDKPWDKDFFLKQLKKLVKNIDCKQRIRQLQLIYKNNIEERNKLFNKIKSNQTIVDYVNILQVGTFLNEYRKSIFCQANLKIRPFLNKAAKKIGLKNWQEISFLTPDEIVESFKKPNFNEVRKKVNSRKKNFCMLSSSGEIRFCTPEESDFIKKHFSILAPKKRKQIIKKKTIKEFKGEIACSGMIKGRVKIVLIAKDIPKVKKDNILVAKMTTVEFIPAMKLASAFITNEGGITCHAAIVARETNKPCIIGTKIATKVLKDGDLVEVNANKGVVKILNRVRK